MSDDVKIEDLEALVAHFEASEWKQMHLRFRGMELFVAKDPDAQISYHIGRGEESPPAAKTVRPSDPPLSAKKKSATAALAKAAPVDVPAHWKPVVAPNLGTFYRAPKPGAAPYVGIGQPVKADTEICLIEVMKLFTSLEAGVAGEVKRICASDGELIAQGQVLFYIEPNA